jgi:hypothetical protein
MLTVQRQENTFPRAARTGGDGRTCNRVAAAVGITSVSLRGQHVVALQNVYTIVGQERGDPGTMIAHNLSTGEEQEFYRLRDETLFDFMISRPVNRSPFVPGS